MNREIKFRAWHNGMYENVLVDGQIWTANIREDLWHSGNIMQFTGLKDNKRTPEYPNGQDIYEGDIVETFLNKHGKPIGNGFKSKIQYNSYVGQWQIAYLNINNTFVSDSIGFSYFLEVIGNIYESPLAEG